jgi:hypothetical protein
MKLSFGTNVPIEVCLDSLDGELCDSQYGGPQRKYMTTDRDIFYVSEPVGKIIGDACRRLKIDAGEPVVICKAEVSDGRGRKTIRWQVTRVNPIGQQADGTFAMPAVSHTNGANGSQPPAPPVAPTTQVQQPVPVINGNGTANGGGGHVPPPANPLAHSGWALQLKEQAQTLIDIYAELMQYAATRHGGLVKAEDVRSILLSAYINVSKSNGGAR